MNRETKRKLHDNIIKTKKEMLSKHRQCATAARTTLFHFKKE